ncbi:alpha/beta fold hydrolase [Arabiibacter massiliensis]|uniref:alpha/beta fold hydrolase n=1 Tax=Arabiibacter massiliensis TaxID=1870985 RepID=UPI001E324092|nr:alpha/beta fold hydrolase [Arabiibacter massiliensis]
MALAIIAVVVFAGAAAFAVYASDYYHADDTARESLASTAALPVAQGDGYLAFGDASARTGIVLYPGAKVEYSAYAPLMRDLAERGYLAVVVEMPFNFAFFGIDAADRVRAAYPQVGIWWVGGHSLGGSMAAQYAANHADDDALGGVVLLGAYSASDLSATDLGAIVVYGSNDQVLNRDKLAEGAVKLPADAETVVIEGGNHAGFGDYGPQEGDGEAAVSADEQQEQAADAIAQFIENAA